MKILINGGCGFLGSNLASYGIEQGHDITVFDNLSRLGASSNREWLKSLGDFSFIHGDMRNKNDVETVIKEGKFDAVFHLAGQVAMTTSIANPYMDFEINAMGALNLLDSIRKYSPETAVFFSSNHSGYFFLNCNKSAYAINRFEHVIIAFCTLSGSFAQELT